jgi:hypothetical protein
LASGSRRRWRRQATLEGLEHTALKTVAVTAFESLALDVKNVDDARTVKKAKGSPPALIISEE